MDLSKGYYEAILDLIDRFFDGDIDQAHFEEYTRYVFVTEAYLLFTIDKLVHTMVKQVTRYAHKGKIFNWLYRPKLSSLTLNRLN